jgi:hypothetical protein
LFFKKKMPEPKGAFLDHIYAIENKKAICAYILIAFVVLVVILVAVVAIVTVCLVSTQTGTQQYCFVNGATIGYITFNENDRSISWYFQTTGTQNIYIYGPIAPGDTTGPFLISLCGKKKRRSLKILKNLSKL